MFYQVFLFFICGFHSSSYNMYFPVNFTYVVHCDEGKSKCPKAVCRLKSGRGKNHIECTKCKQLYHCSCVKLTKAMANATTDFICPGGCESQN